MNKKQIKEQNDKLIVIMRQYIVGLQPPCMIKNALKCLFADVYLDTKKYYKKPIGCDYGNFDELWEKIIKEV